MNGFVRPWPHLLGSLDPYKSAPQTASRSVQPFLPTLQQSPNAFFSVGRTTTKIAFGPPGLAPKWHLDQFNRFRRAHECDQQTHTDIPTAALATLHAQLPRPHRFVYFCVMTQQDVHGDCQRWSKICVGTFLVRKVQSRGKTLKFELILTVKMKTRHHIWW